MYYYTVKVHHPSFVSQVYIDGFVFLISGRCRYRVLNTAKRGAGRISRRWIYRYQSDFTRLSPPPFLSVSMGVRERGE